MKAIQVILIPLCLFMALPVFASSNCKAGETEVHNSSASEGGATITATGNNGPVQINAYKTAATIYLHIPDQKQTDSSSHQCVSYTSYIATGSSGSIGCKNASASMGGECRIYEGRFAQNENAAIENGITVGGRVTGGGFSDIGMASNKVGETQIVLFGVNGSETCCLPCLTNTDGIC
tara:strand:+ start:22261 stop:22794 length:534 start_codon:yes stop_codon:yes gene_type:complete